MRSIPFGYNMRKAAWLGVIGVLVLCALPLALYGGRVFLHSQDDIITRGVEAFNETCLTAAPRFEKIYQWATERELKVVDGNSPQRGSTRIMGWEVAASGSTTVMLHVIAGYQPSAQNLICQLIVNGQRDADKRVERYFLDEIKRHPNARQQAFGSGLDKVNYFFVDGKTQLGYVDSNERKGPQIALNFSSSAPPPDVALPRTFATPERSYRLFVNDCLARFPNIEGIADHMNTRGWQRVQSPEKGPIYRGSWMLYDPFFEMIPFEIDVMQSKALRMCTFSFDIRTAFPMERLIRDYSLVQTDSPIPGQRLLPGVTITYYAGAVSGTRTRFSLRTNNDTQSAELSVFIDTSLASF